jgi:hypothetical protein
MSTTGHPVLKVKRYSTPSVLGKSYLMANGFAADPGRFANPNPPLPVFQGQIVKVENASKIVLSGAKGAAAVCKVERDRLYRMLVTQCVYVATLCAENPEEAAVIAQAVGLDLSAAPKRERPILRVAHGPGSGSVELRANVSLLLGGRKGKAKFFDWQWTTDGGQTFHDATATTTGKTTITGLQPLTITGFRVKATTTGNPGEWSPIVYIVIH